jgi:hypothetical protein
VPQPKPVLYRVPDPPRQRPPRKSGWHGLLDLLIFQQSQVQGIACGLLALSAVDLFVTFTLLRTGPAFFESNPVAQWFFARWNIAGMVAFKFSIIGAVIVVSEFIERRRPGWGRFVLMIGCVGAAYAAYKGLSLYLAHYNPLPDDAD